MSKQTKSFYSLQKENAELRKELKFYKELNVKRKESIKKIKVSTSHNNFYMSREWKELRYKVIMKHKIEHGSICLSCNKTTSKLHVDHILPRSKRPDLELEITNLQVLCPDCNVGKSNKDSTDWSKYKKAEIFE